jgi:membrane protein
MALTWRALRRFYDHQMTQHAAALSYYAMLALFPSLLVAVALLGVLGQEDTVTDVVGYLDDQGAPVAVTAPIEALLRGVIRTSDQTAGLALAISLALSLLGASGWFASARRALNAALDVPEERAFVGRKLGDLGATLVLIGLGLAVLVTLFLGGGVADDLFDQLGIGREAADVWQVARWPVALAVTLGAYAFVYAVAPDASPRHWRWFTPGALIAVPLWLIVSYGFFWYVSHLGQLAGYGTLAAALVLLVWLFLSHAALLLGAVFNAEVTHAERRAG